MKIMIIKLKFLILLLIFIIVVIINNIYNNYIICSESKENKNK